MIHSLHTNWRCDEELTLFLQSSSFSTSVAAVISFSFIYLLATQACWLSIAFYPVQEIFFCNSITLQRYFFGTHPSVALQLKLKNWVKPLKRALDYISMQRGCIESWSSHYFRHRKYNNKWTYQTHKIYIKQIVFFFHWDSSCRSILAPKYKFQSKQETGSPHCIPTEILFLWHRTRRPSIKLTNNKSETKNDY